jgi:steroid delta-isomerase-like uncharacterized protein
MSVSPRQLEANKQIVLRMMEAFNSGDTSVVDELVHPETHDKAKHIGLHPSIRSAPAIENIKHQIMMDREAVPDGKFEVMQIIAEDDRVVLQWRLTGTNKGPLLGRPATGKKIDIQGTEFVRIENGQIVEHDDAGYHALEALRQLGLITDPKLAEELFSGG